MTDLIRRDDAIRELNGACSNWEDDAKVQEIVMAIPSAEAEQVTGKLIDGLEMLRFFNQRAGRELWQTKPREIQNTDIKDADEILSKAISALSAEAVQGEWVIRKNGNKECSLCGHERQDGWDYFCGYCGARMKGGDDE